MKKIILLFTTVGLLFSLDYSLEDVNPNSATFGLNVGPSYFQLQGQPISINAFNWEN